MRHSRAFLTILAAVGASAAASCGDNSKRCGEGTQANAQGYCVPVETTTCGAGTVEVNGECVPDGTVICEQGTVYDETVGGCVPSEDACAEGTVLVDGRCVPEDETLTADLTEAAEPNDGAGQGEIAGAFALPAVGQARTLHGCITPYQDRDGNGNPDPDFDMWIIQASGPSLIEVTADGVGGLAAGFYAVAGTDDDDFDAEWIRFGVNLTGDTSRRQIYLPADGIYALVMADSRSLFLSEGAAGGPDTCYYTTVRNLPIPSPTAITANTLVEGTIGGDTQFFRYVPVEGDLIELRHDIASQAAAPSVVTVQSGDLRVGEPTPGLFGGQTAGDAILLVVEPVYNYALAPVPYGLEVHAYETVALPTDGSSITVTNTDGNFETLDALTWAYFDVPEDAMVHFDLATDGPDVHFLIATAELGIVTDITGLVLWLPEPTDEFAGWVKFPAAGRYYMVLWEPDADDGTWELTSTVTMQEIRAVTLGTADEDVELGDLRVGWHHVDPASEAWLGFHAAATGFGGVVRTDLYNDANIGVVDLDFGRTQRIDLPANGSATRGRVTFNEGTQWLVRITDSSAATAPDATYDLTVAPRVATNFGLLDETSTVDEVGSLDDGEAKLYFLRAGAGYTVTIRVQAHNWDLVLELLNRDESNRLRRDATGDGGVEQVTVVMDGSGWLAFRVYEYFGNADDFDLTITVTPPPYLVATGSTAYTDICGATGAVTLAQTPVGSFDAVGDEAISAVQTMPFAFELAGQAATSYYVSTNGFLSFNAPTNNAFFSNASMPSTAAPNGLIAPYWDDLDAITLCKLEEADRVTIQWQGIVYLIGTTVRAQAILHDDHRVEFVYGAHTSNGSGATVGIESLDGTRAVQVGFNQPVAPANSSTTLTPTW